MKFNFIKVSTLTFLPHLCLNEPVQDNGQHARHSINIINCNFCRKQIETAEKDRIEAGEVFEVNEKEIAELFAIGRHGFLHLCKT